MAGLSAGSNGVSTTGFEPQAIPVICLMGPTATGKTDAAAQLSDAIDGEIVSVDSSLVYIGMDVGSAKPEPAFLKKHPHHLVDIRHPNDAYSVADFYTDCHALIEQISRAGRVPVLAGGTMFYFRALERGLTELPKADQALRAQISQEAQADGWAFMHQRLAVLDPQSAERIDSTDAQRIQRALEIVLSSGKTVSEHNAAAKPPISNPLIKIALSYSDRKVLHRRIEQRFDQMLDLGLKSEVERLLKDGVEPDSTAMKMIGYRQMLEFLRGDTSYQNMRSKGIAATRQLAKRQLTWLRNQNNVVWWVDVGLKDKKFQPLVSLIKQFIR